MIKHNLKINNENKKRMDGELINIYYCHQYILIKGLGGATLTRHVHCTI
jgi:hypothetical protein